MIQGKARWIVRFVAATIALIVICALIQPKIDAEIARRSVELATEQMEIEGSQEYSVYQNIAQVCYWALRIAGIGMLAYIGFCSYCFVCKKGENENEKH